MRKLAIIAMLLLGSIVISFLILPRVYKDPYDFSGTQLQTKDNEVQYDEDPIPPPDSPPKPSSGIRYAKVFNISASADDAWTAPGGTTSGGATLDLGGINNLNHANSRKICLRWNVSIPANSSVISAYLNLTVESIATWNGFRSYILPFDNSTTPDFSDAGENIQAKRPRSYPGVEWIWPTNATGLILADKSYSSPSLVTLMNRIIDRADWKNNSIFGLYIEAYGLGAQQVQNGERIYFHSLDGGNPDYAPKLIVEWEANPGFRSVPSDLTINNNTLGYHIEWNAADDNPTTYTIFGNETIGESTQQVDYGTWESEVDIRYDIPRIDIQNYPFVIVNYTITIYDEDSNFDVDTVLINVTDKGLPTIDVKFVQDNKKFSYEKQNYFECHKGPFTIQIYNTTPIYPTVTFSAYYPLNRLNIWSGLMLLGFIPAVGNIFCTDRTHLPATCYSFWQAAYHIDEGSDTEPPAMTWSLVDFNYSDVAGCWQLIPTVGAPGGKGALNHTFQLAIYLPILPSLSIYAYYGFPIQDLLYGLTNYIVIDLGEEFIYLNQTVSTVKGGMWDQLNFSMLNKDTSPPSFCEPIFTEPKEPDLHYEIRLLVFTEEHGADIDEVYLYYNIDDGAWKRTEMALQYGNYYGEIPPQEGGAKITYYIEMVDIAGNIIATDEYEETAVTFEEPSPIVPILGILLAFLGALSLVVILRYRSKKAFKKASAEKLIKKPKKGVIEKE